MERISKLVVGTAVSVVSATYLSAQAPNTSGRASAGTAPTTVAANDHEVGRALVNRYCVTCHNGRVKNPPGGLALDSVITEQVSNNPEVWEKVVRKVRSGMMPPSGRPRPDESALNQWVTSVEGELDRMALAHPNPGRTEALHRLNRTEYHNAIRDLLSLDVNVATLLPVDDASYGFDNIAGVLKLNQSLMESYLSAARKISRLAVGTAGSSPISDTYKVSDEASQYERLEGLPFGTRGGMLVRHNFPQNGEYTFHTEFMGSKVEAAGYDTLSGFVDPHEFELLIDGEQVESFTIEPKPLRRLEATEKSGIEFRVHVSAGLHDVGVTFLKLPGVEEADGVRVRFQKPQFQSFMVPPNLAVYQPFVNWLIISGPFNPAGAGETASRRRVFVCRPTGPQKEEVCAKQILGTIARRAYRRPITTAEIQDLLKFYKSGRGDGGNFDAGIEWGLRRVLASADFLFRVESAPSHPHGSVAPTATKSSTHDSSARRDSLFGVLPALSPQERTATPDGAKGTAPALSAYRISDTDLASRLSFFLWSSIPDDELLGLAERGKLHDADVLEKQVTRMLADPRSDTLVNNFALQWLQLRQLQTVRPDYVLFPDFDDSLRDAFIQETELFVNNIRREDRSVLELLNGRTTFVNGRLAAHYGIPNVQGSQFRRIELPADSPRRGILGQGSILTLTSKANRTSPVARGKWILENILGTPPPDPPPGVPPFPEKQASNAPTTVRETMSAHRANPACASCHAMIDPPGFALEHFDAIGRYRINDEGSKPIDTSGVLPDGTKFNDVGEFREALLKHPDRFVTTFTEKLLTYALGRGLGYYDAPSVRSIVHQAAAKNYQWSSIVLGIVRSVPFQMRRSISS